MIDGRLLLPAGGAWLGAALATWALSLPQSMVARHEASARSLVVGAGAVLLVAVIPAVPAVRRRLAPWGQSVVLVIGCLLLGATSAAMASASSTAAPLAAWIDARATAVVRGEVAGEPLVRVTGSAPVWQSSSRVEVRLDAERVSARGESIEVDVPMMLSLGPEAVVPPPGTVVEVTGRLRAIPQRLGAVAALSVSGGPGGVDVHGPPGAVDTIAHAMRAGLRESLAGAPPAAGSLVAGLAVGDDSWQPPELATAMRDSGLSHLTAVSGGNVAIVLGLVFALVTLLRLPLPARVIAAMAALGYFVVLVGPQPSVLRAAAMGVIAVAGVLAGGRRSGPSILGAGVLVLVVVAPWLAVSWAFALSAFATAGLILLAPRLEDRLAVGRLTCRWPPAIRQALALTGAAQLATLPILVAMGGAVGWVALPANLLAMPAVAPVTVLGLLAAAVSPVAPGLADVIAGSAAWPAGWIARVAEACAELPLARLPWPRGRDRPPAARLRRGSSRHPPSGLDTPVARRGEHGCAHGGRCGPPHGPRPGRGDAAGSTGLAAGRLAPHHVRRRAGRRPDRARRSGGGARRRCRARARCGGRLPGRGRHHGGAGGDPHPLPRRPRARAPRRAARTVGRGCAGDADQGARGGGRSRGRGPRHGWDDDRGGDGRGREVRGSSGVAHDLASSAHHLRIRPQQRQPRPDAHRGGSPDPADGRHRARGTGRGRGGPAAPAIRRRQGSPPRLPVPVAAPDVVGACSRGADQRRRGQRLRASRQRRPWTPGRPSGHSWRGRTETATSPSCRPTAGSASSRVEQARWGECATSARAPRTGE